MKALITSLCALLWMGTAWAQGAGSLTGKVSDAEGGGVPQANVVVAGSAVFKGDDYSATIGALREAAK